MLIEVDTAAEAKGKPARLLRPALARGLVIGRSWQSERSLIDALPAHDGSDSRHRAKPEVLSRRARTHGNSPRRK